MRDAAPPWRLEPTLRFLALLPLALAASGLVLEFAARASGMPAEPRPTWWLAANTGLVHGLVLGLAALLLREHRLSWTTGFGLLAPGWPRRWVFAVLLTIPALLVAWLAHQGSARLLELFQIPHDTQSAIDAIRRSGHAWERGLMLLFAVVTAPMAEEVLFRGILFSWLRGLGFPKMAYGGSALLFALIHFNAAAFLPLGLLGLFWAWLYQRTGDLGAPILSHAAFNLVNFAWIVFSPASGPPS